MYDASLLRKVISLTSVADCMQARPRSKTIAEELLVRTQISMRAMQRKKDECKTHQNATPTISDILI